MEYNSDSRRISISIKALEMDREVPAETATVEIPAEVTEALKETAEEAAPEKEEA